jgi:hypothetical protein
LSFYECIQEQKANLFFLGGYVLLDLFDVLFGVFDALANLDIFFLEVFKVLFQLFAYFGFFFELPKSKLMLAKMSAGELS